jgi:hypothetical protein
MPMIIVLHPARRLIYMRVVGSVSREDILERRQQAAQHPGFDPMFDALVDLREADLSQLSGQDIAALASTSTLRPSARRVFVAHDDAAFGVSRMFAEWANINKSAEGLTIVRTFEEALQALGHPGLDPAVEPAVS